MILIHLLLVSVFFWLLDWVFLRLLLGGAATTDLESFFNVVHDHSVLLCESVASNLLLQVAKDFVGSLQLSLHVFLGFLARLLFQLAKFSVFSCYLLFQILCLSLHSS